MTLPASYTESSLLKACRRGDPRAQQVFYEHFAPPMMGVCLRYAQDREEASEMLQDGFVKAFLQLKQYRGQGSLEGWLRRIMVTTALDRLRRSQTYRAHLDAYEVEVASAGIANDALDQLAVEDLYRCIQALPPMTRTVFNLFAVEGFSHAEIAKRLKLSPGTSQWHVSTARKTLQALILTLNQQPTR